MRYSDNILFNKKNTLPIKDEIMKLPYLFYSLISLSILYALDVSADVEISSPLGTKLIFSDKKIGEKFDQSAWNKLFFSNNQHTIELSMEGRYFTEDSSFAKLSPSGKYIVITSVDYGYVEDADGEKTFRDKAYCNVIDMRDGCIVSEWDGLACSYDWKKDKDILSSSDEEGAETFDFLLQRAEIRKAVNNMKSLDDNHIKDYLRCDMPKKDNINIYQKLIKENKKAKPLVIPAIKSYLSSIKEVKALEKKSFLYASPDNNSKLKSYLIAGDKVKIINKSEDNQWLNVAYIKANGDPLIAWIKVTAEK